MKKILTVSILILALLCSCFAFTACTKKDETKPETLSNEENIALAAASAASVMSGSGSASAASSEDSGYAGITVSGNVSVSSTVVKYVGNTISETLTCVECFVRENGVTIEKVTSDNADYAILYNITSTDTNGEKTVVKLYVNATKTVDGQDVATTDINDETVTTYKLKGLLVAGESSLNFTCTTEVIDSKPYLVMKIAASESIYVQIKALANSETANFSYEMNVLGFKATATVAVGKLADENNVYGVDVDVAIELTVADVKVAVEVYHSTVDNKPAMTVDGTVVVTVLRTAAVTVDVSGSVTKNEDDVYAMNLSVAAAASVAA